MTFKVTFTITITPTSKQHLLDNSFVARSSSLWPQDFHANLLALIWGKRRKIWERQFLEKSILIITVQQNK